MHRVVVALLFVCAMAPLAHAGDPPVPEAAALLQSPIPHACISSPFGFRHRIGFLPAQMHNGIDIPAPAGATVHAVAPGRVLAVHHRGPGGLELLLSHDNGHVVTIYSHLGSVAPEIAFGKTVIKTGDRLGVVGHSGVTYGMHLYFEVTIDGRPVDPAPLLGIQTCGTAAGAVTQTVGARAARSVRLDPTADPRIPPTVHGMLLRGGNRGFAPSPD